MADPHVLTGLIAKRAQIAGQIEHIQDQLRQLVIDLDNAEFRRRWVPALAAQQLAENVPAIGP